MPTALITGATAGIGLEFARQLAARGDDLVLVARTADRLDSVCRELTDRYGVAAQPLVADLSVRADVDRVAQRAADVDVVVNNAGFGWRKSFLVNDLDAEEQVLDVMCRAVMVICHSAGRAMKTRGAGTIINVSSVAGWIASGTYSVAKSWVTVFTEGLAGELTGSGVSVTVLCPGFVHTEFHERAQIRESSVPGPLWLDAPTVVRECLADVAKGKVISVPSLRYKGLANLARIAPRRFVRSGGVVTRHRPPSR